MIKKRIGKDIAATWTITTNGEAVPLDPARLTVEIQGCNNYIIPALTVEGNVVRFVWRGVFQIKTEVYTITLWQDKGKPGQTCVDEEFVELVPRTWDEIPENEDGDLELETIDLGTSDLDIGSGGGAATSFDELSGRPKYNGMSMSSQTDIPEVPVSLSDLEDDEEHRTVTDAEKTSWSGKQNAISDLETIRSKAMSALQPSALNPYRTASEQDEIDDELESRLDTIDEVIPAQASSSNQLADKSFVNSSVQTAAAELESQINKVVLNGMTQSEDGSTVKLTLAKINIKTGATSSQEVSLPVADASGAGVMNPQTYQTIQSNQTLINALLGASVAVSGLSASPTQAQVTAAWRTATGLTDLVNGARVFDVTNQKVWTYFTNDTTWHPVSADGGGSVEISQWTNSALGTIKGVADNTGHTNDGKITAETDGTGSVLGWDRLTSRVGDVEDAPAIQDTDYTHTDNNYTDTEKGKVASALQPSALNAYRTSSQQDTIDAGKVDKVTGKGLSTNDYTTEDKQKVSSAVQPADIVNFVTKSVNDLLNYYLKSETYTKTEVQALIDAVKQFSYEVVSVLPTASASTMHKIYLVPSSDPQSQNIKDEYITIDNGSSASTRYTWEQIGSTAIDLSNYHTIAEETAVINAAIAPFLTETQIRTIITGYGYATATVVDGVADRVSAIEAKEDDWDGKQDAINDIATIRANASAGKAASDEIAEYGNIVTHNVSEFATSAQGTKADTAYQKPSSGIPKADLGSGVKNSLEKADTALQSSDLVDNVGKTSSSAVKASGIYAEVHPPIGSAIPSDGMLPNTLYHLGTLTGSVNMKLASAADSTVGNHYFFTFETGSTVPSITWSSSIIKWYCPFNEEKQTGTKNQAPILSANKHYEVSVENGVAVAMEV